MNTLPSNRRMHAEEGFSLVEMLVVLAIIAILSALSVPLVGMVGAGNVNSAVSGITDLLNQSRAYAMAHDTYVWVGFSGDSTSQPQGLAVGIVAGASGQSTDLTAQNGYFPISTVHLFRQTGIQKVSSMAAIDGTSSSPTDDLSTSSSSGASTQFNLPFAGQNVQFSQILQYDPEGAASAINTDAGTTHQIQIGLEPQHGSTANAAVFEVTSLTGQVRVFRP